MKNKLVFPIALSIVILVSGAISYYFFYNYLVNQPLSVKNTVATQITEEMNKKDLKTIIHESQKNVVQIETITEFSEKLGSGFLYNDKGDIITNAHVVKDAVSIYVKTANAQTYTAALVGIGEDKDIAVIRVPQLANHTPARIEADDFFAELGDEILAVGSPLGFQNSVTLGIISGLNRTFTIDDYDYKNVYQISATITHGNSGGPLINKATGNVIGINSAGYDEGNLGFSIPIHSVLDQVKQWSEEADDKELNYNSLYKNSLTDNVEQLQEDATYIINYYFDSLIMRDYINSYTLFGSQMQTKTSYQNFRQNYIHVDQLKIKELETTYLDEEQLLKVTLTADVVVRKSSQDLTEETYDYTFNVGLENDQLKILDVNRELISSSNLSSEE